MPGTGPAPAILHRMVDSQALAGAWPHFLTCSQNLTGEREPVTALTFILGCRGSLNNEFLCSGLHRALP
jgi:hypothetical protein